MAGLGPCFNPAGQVILKGLAGNPCSVVIGGFHLHIRNKGPITRGTGGPGGAGAGIAHAPAPAPIPQQKYYDDPEVDPNIIDLNITVKWPLINKKKNIKFTMERKWANMIVYKLKQINTFNGKMKVKFKAFKNDLNSNNNKKG